MVALREETQPDPPPHTHTHVHPPPPPPPPPPPHNRTSLRYPPPQTWLSARTAPASVTQQQPPVVPLEAPGVEQRGGAAAQSTESRRHTQQARVCMGRGERRDKLYESIDRSIDSGGGRELGGRCDTAAAVHDAMDGRALRSDDQNGIPPLLDTGSAWDTNAWHANTPLPCNIRHHRHLPYSPPARWRARAVAGRGGRDVIIRGAAAASDSTKPAASSNSRPAASA